MCAQCKQAGKQAHDEGGGGGGVDDEDDARTDDPEFSFFKLRNSGERVV